MTTNKKVLAGIAIAMSAGMLLAGCASSGNSESASTTTAASLPSTDWVRADAADIKDGGDLTLAMDDVIAQFNQDHILAGTVDGDTVADLYLPRYVNMKEDGTWEPNPEYVDSIELTNDDPQTVEVVLNKDAAWSDGTAMTAADFIGMWKSHNGTDPAYEVTSTNIFQDMASVEQGATDKEFTITFAKVNADWMAVFDNIVPAWVTATPEAFNSLWLDLPVAADGKTVVSGGPFIVKTYDKNAGILTFERNPAWWGETPKLDTVTFVATDRTAAGQSFVNKELDAVQINASVDTYNQVQSRKDAKVLASQGVTFSHMTLNGTSEVLKDQDVRQAFAQSIDREVLTKAMVEPLGVAPETLNNLIFLAGQNGYEDDSENIAYDPEAAAAKLEKAGWVAEKDGDIRTKDGKKLTIRLVIPSETPNSATIAQAIQPMAAAVGIDVQIDTVPSADFFTKYVIVPNRDFDATLFAWQGTPFPISSVQSIYYPADSNQNFAGITDESLGDDWAKANAELDENARLDEARAIDKKLMDLAVTIPFYARPLQYAVADGLVNYGPAQFETFDWTQVGWAK